MSFIIHSCRLTVRWCWPLRGVTQGLEWRNLSFTVSEPFLESLAPGEGGEMSLTFTSFPLSQTNNNPNMNRDAGLTREELERPPAASAVRDLRATLHHLLQVWLVCWMIQNHISDHRHFPFFQFWPSLAASSPWVSCSHLNYLDHQPMDMQGLNNLRV